MFHMYCQAYDRWQDAGRDIRTHGPVESSPNGHTVQSPHLAIANRAMAQIERYVIEFGMTPASRSRIGIEIPSERDKELDRFLYGPRPWRLPRP